MATATKAPSVKQLQARVAKLSERLGKQKAAVETTRAELLEARIALKAAKDAAG